MGSSKQTAAAACCVLAFALCGLLLAETAAAAVTCNPAALSPCTGAIMMGGAVTPACCTQLRAQQPCLCQYARNPSFAAYVNSAGAQSAVRACGIPRPRC